MCHSLCLLVYQKSSIAVTHTTGNINSFNFFFFIYLNFNVQVTIPNTSASETKGKQTKVQTELFSLINYLLNCIPATRIRLNAAVVHIKIEFFTMAQFGSTRGCLNINYKQS